MSCGVIYLDQKPKSFQRLYPDYKFSFEKKLKDKTKCSHKEFEEYRGQKFCKECGDILSGELCFARGCIRYHKPKGKICMESKQNL